MIWTVLSPKTLKTIKEELLIYVQDVSKDMSDRDTRQHLTELLRSLDEIDAALELLGANDGRSHN